MSTAHDDADHPGAAGAPTPPRYGHRSLADVVPAITTVLAARHAAGDDPPPAIEPVGRDRRQRRGSGRHRGDLVDELADLPARVVLLVADGLGADVLDAHAAAAPRLIASPGADVDAVFPPTTVASLASIGTGRPPSRHGLVGYAWPVPDHGHPLCGLSWRTGLRGGGRDVRDTIVPEQLQPGPTALERAHALGIATTTVLDPDHLDSGLTRAALRGGQRLGARGITATLDRAVETAVGGDGPALVYAHDPTVDDAGHEFGPDSDETRDAVADLDRALDAVGDALPPDVAVLVTADHGMVGIPEGGVVELTDLPALAHGVRVIAGEPRGRHVAVAEDADVDEVAATWRRVLGSRATVLSRQEALPLFGPDPTAAARQAIGDLVVLAAEGVALVHARVDPHGGRLPGQHGGPTTAERLVPLRRLSPSAS